tara:strand:- start:444 stop:1694 length:1251 start_codon:yes stop_codon:yes gene_type:complete
MTITTQRQVNALKIGEKRYNKGCGDGLYIKVEAEKRGGGKYYWGQVKNKTIWIGTNGDNVNQYNLKSAKEKWFKIKNWSIKNNLPPREYKKKERVSTTYTLRDAINGFLKNIAPTIKETTLKEYDYKLNRSVLNHISEDTKLIDLQWDNGGRIRIKNVLDKIANGRKYELRERCRKLIKQTCDYAIDEGWMVRGQNPAEKERRAEGHKIVHHKSIDFNQVPDLVRAVSYNKCNAEYNTILCTKLMLCTALRAGAATRLKWDWIKEINGIKCISIAGDTEGLKRRKGTSDHIPHHVPITKEIELILEKSKDINGAGQEYIFPAWRTRKYPHLNPEAPNKFLQNIGYKDVLVAHGVRSIFMTASKEKLKYDHKIIDLQLGHIHANKVDAAYDRSQMLEERKDLLDKFNGLLVEMGLVI